MAATRIVPLAEVTERLGSLDMANPSFRETKVVKPFLKFVESLAIFNRPKDRIYSDGVTGTIKPIPPIVWLYGVHDYRSRLLDLGVYPGNFQGIWGAIQRHNHAIHRAIGHPTNNLVQEYQTILIDIFRIPEWRSISLHDENLLQAFEAGLGLFLFRDNAIVLFPRPGILLRNEMMPQQRRQTTATSRRVLHSLRGPAVNFPQDKTSDQFWIRGVRVPRFVVENPERITRAHIRAARTAVLRQTLIDQYGLLRYSLERGFKQADRDDRHGAILYVRGGNRARYGGQTIRECVVDLINSTPEPDGTQRHFARRVPGDILTARAAVAWTFNMTPTQYHPDVQT